MSVSSPRIPSGSVNHSEWNGADVLDRAVGRGPLGQAVPQHAERGGRISGEREVVEMTALEHRRTGRAVLVAEHLDRMQPANPHRCAGSHGGTPGSSR